MTITKSNRILALEAYQRTMLEAGDQHAVMDVSVDIRIQEAYEKGWEKGFQEGYATIKERRTQHE